MDWPQSSTESGSVHYTGLGTITPLLVYDAAAAALHAVHSTPACWCLASHRGLAGSAWTYQQGQQRRSRPARALPCHHLARVHPGPGSATAAPAASAETPPSGTCCSAHHRWQSAAARANMSIIRQWDGQPCVALAICVAEGWAVFRMHRLPSRRPCTVTIPVPVQTLLASQ